MVKLDTNDKVIVYCFHLFVVEAIDVMVVRIYPVFLYNCMKNILIHVFLSW